MMGTIIDSIRLILILCISGSLLSCNGHVSSANKKSVLTEPELGKLTSVLDDQIWAIFQDQKGIYWFGSNGNGVYRFDGKNLRQFTTRDGLISDQIRGMQEDVDGHLYVETPSGVSKYDGHTFSTLKVIRSPDNQWKLEPNDLWFNCNGNAHHVYRFDGKNLFELQLPAQNIEERLGISVVNSSYSPYTVYGIDKDKSGNLWLGTVLAGAFRFDGLEFLWICEKELSRLPDGREPGVRSILEDRDGHIWLSNFKSKYRIKPNSSQPYEKLKAVDLSPEIIEEKILYFNAGTNDHDGNLWMTTYGGGVWKYDGQTLSNFELRNGTEDLLLISIHRDNEGKIWLGTHNDGAYVQNGDRFEKFSIY